MRALCSLWRVYCLGAAGKNVAYVGVRSKEESLYAKKALPRYLEMKVPGVSIGEFVGCAGKLPKVFDEVLYYEQACRVREMPIGHGSLFHFCGADNWDVKPLGIYTGGNVVEYRKVPSRKIPVEAWEKAKWLAEVEEKSRQPKFKKDKVTGKLIELVKNPNMPYCYAENPEHKNHPYIL